MADLTKLCATSDIAEGTVKSFEVGSNVLAVYNVGGEFFVTDNECTHGAPCFTALRTYKVVLQDGQVMVDLDKEAGE
jgi:nitrite reductase/ring-hydroxylating ferredoxin subunit